MTLLRISTFTGETPRLPPHLLPETAAQYAKNCDFSHGELRSLPSPGAVTPACAAVRSVYSPGAGAYLTWPLYTRAQLSPTIDDMHERVYFWNEDGFRVTTRAETPETPCAPLNSWRVGLPVPGSEEAGGAGSISIGTSFVDVNAEFELMWEKNGVHFEDIPIIIVDTVTPGRDYLLHYDAATGNSPIFEEWHDGPDDVSGSARAINIDGVEFAVPTDVAYSRARAIPGKQGMAGDAGVTRSMHNVRFLGELGGRASVLSGNESVHTSGGRTGLANLPTTINTGDATGGVLSGYPPRAARLSSWGYNGVYAPLAMIDDHNDAYALVLPSGDDAAAALVPCFEQSVHRPQLTVTQMAGQMCRITGSVYASIYGGHASAVSGWPIRTEKNTGYQDGFIVYTNAATWAYSYNYTANAGTEVPVDLVLTVTKLRQSGSDAWVTFNDAVGARLAGATLVARVSGMLNGEAFSTYTLGSLQPKDSARGVIATLSVEEPGLARIRLSYTQAGSDASGSAAYTSSAAYCVTFVDDWGEESAPSEAVVLDLSEGASGKVQATYHGFVDGRPATGMNLYRTYGTSDTYLLVNPQPIPPADDNPEYFTYTDASVVPQTTTALATAEWDPPPHELKFLTYAGNGFFVGAKGKDVYMSEPYYPHAWPYIMTFTREVAGFCPVEGGVLAVTTGQPFVIYGAHPEQATQQVISADQAGVSQRALARVSGGATYVSNDGLVSIAGGRAELTASRALFTRADWRERYRDRFADIVLGEHDGQLVMLFDREDKTPYPEREDGILLSIEEPELGLTRLSLPRPPVGLSTVTEDDALYFGFAPEGSLPGGFAEAFVGDDLTLVWQSRDTAYPRPVAFGAAIILCRGNFTIEILAGGAVIFTRAVTSGETQLRLPPYPADKRWSVRFTGQGSVQKFEMASSFEELKGG
jgi:hypothetical protein